jgi:hypothetical protein
MTDLQTLVAALDELLPEELEELRQEIVQRLKNVDDEGVYVTQGEASILLEAFGDALDEEGNIDISKLDLYTVDLDKLIEESERDAGKTNP